MAIGDPSKANCTELCQEIRAVLDLSATPTRRAKYYNTDADESVTVAGDLLGRARQLLAEAESYAHNVCVTRGAI